MGETASNMRSPKRSKRGEDYEPKVEPSSEASPSHSLLISPSTAVHFLEEDSSMDQSGGRTQRRSTRVRTPSRACLESFQIDEFAAEAFIPPENDPFRLPKPKPTASFIHRRGRRRRIVARKTATVESRFRLPMLLKRKLNPTFPASPFLQRNLAFIITAAKRDRRTRRRHHHHLQQLEDNTWHFHLREKKSSGAITVKSGQRDLPNCPLCELTRFRTIEVLWLHCRTMHSDKYKFRAARTEDEWFHLLAEAKSKAPEPSRKETALLYWRGRSSDVPVAVEQEKPLSKVIKRRVALPKRQYYHSASNVAFSLGDWMMDADSDNEIDEGWKHQVAEARLDEFDDVSTKEKHFFKLWNRFCQESNRIPVQKNLPSLCLKFIEQFAWKVKEEELEEQLTWHVVNMWDEGHLSRQHVYDCMQRFSSLVDYATPVPPENGRPPNVVEEDKSAASSASS